MTIQLMHTIEEATMLTENKLHELTTYENLTEACCRQSDGPSDTRTKTADYHQILKACVKNEKQRRVMQHFCQINLELNAQSGDDVDECEKINDAHRLFLRVQINFLRVSLEIEQILNRLKLGDKVGAEQILENAEKYVPYFNIKRAGYNYKKIN